VKFRTVLAVALTVGLTGCGPSPEQSSDQSGDSAGATETAPAQGADAASVAEQAGVQSSGSAVQVSAELEALSALEAKLAKLGCFACHAVDQQRIGPSYRAIAERYRDQQATDSLVNKIISGGGGVWSPMPMTSHPHLTPEILGPLVEQILQLPNK
jgi:cytochrome c